MVKNWAEAPDVEAMLGGLAAWMQEMGKFGGTEISGVMDILLDSLTKAAQAVHEERGLIADVIKAWNANCQHACNTDGRVMTLPNTHGDVEAAVVEYLRWRNPGDCEDDE